MAKKKTGLGRGLDALFADAAPINEEEYIDQTSEEVEPEAAKPAAGKVQPKKAKRTNVLIDKEEDIKDRILYIPINDIKPNHDQPRKHFDEEKLNDLARSIEENGVIQPLVVRQFDNGYELVAGERRWRASRIAGLRKVPCIVRDFDEKQNMIVAIIENMQREDLDPIEEALGIQAMIKRFDFTQEQVAVSLGKSRVYVTNSLRLLKLPEWIQEHISAGSLSAAHGRTIINIEDKAVQKEICDKVIRGGLSVRATEKLANKAKEENKPTKRKKTSKARSSEMVTVEDELRTILGTKVTINGDNNTGKIELEYYSLGELNRLIEILRECK